MPIEYLASGSNAAANSVLLPTTSLYSVIADYQNALEEVNFARFILNFFEKSQNVMNAVDVNGNPTFNHLGIGLAKDLDDPTATTTNKINQVWSFNFQNYATNTAAPVILPTPVSGVGKFDLVSIFSGATKVASGAATASSGVLIPVAELEPYGCPAYAGLSLAANTDNRDVWLAIARYLVDMMEVRATGTISAILGKSVGTPTIPTLPAAYTDSVNPTTGIDASALYSTALVYQQTLGFTLETALDSTTKSYDVSVA